MVSYVHEIWIFVTHRSPHRRCNCHFSSKPFVYDGCLFFVIEGRPRCPWRRTIIHVGLSGHPCIEQDQGTDGGRLASGRRRVDATHLFVSLSSECRNTNVTRGLSDFEKLSLYINIQTQYTVKSLASSIMRIITSAWHASSTLHQHPNVLSLRLSKRVLTSVSWMASINQASFAVSMTNTYSMQNTYSLAIRFKP